MRFKSKDKGLFKNHNDDIQECENIMYDVRDYECCKDVDENRIFSYLSPRDKSKESSCGIVKSINGLSDLKQRENTIEKFKKLYPKIDTSFTKLDPTKDASFLELLRTSEEARQDANVKKNLYMFKKYYSKVKPKDYIEIKTKLSELENVNLLNQVQGDKTVLYSGIYGELSIPQTHEEACKLGSGTRWCTASTSNDSYFKQYTKDGPLYVWKDNILNKKFQFHFESDSYMDEQDERINKDELIHLLKVPVLNQLFKKRLAETKNVFKLFRGMKLKRDEMQELTEFIVDAQTAVDFVVNIYKKRLPQIEPMILSNNDEIVRYSKLVIKKRWPEGEKKLLKKQDALNMANYAIKAIKGRWKEAEDLILNNETALKEYIENTETTQFDKDADEDFLQNVKQIAFSASNPQVTVEFLKFIHNVGYFDKLNKKDYNEKEVLEFIANDPVAATNYARFILEDRWDDSTIGKQAIKSILKSPNASFDYAKYVFEHPWPEGEDTIAKDAKTSLYYAINVLNGVFPKGEDAIAKDGKLALDYAIEVLKDRFPKGEDEIAKNGFNSYNYAKLVGEFPEGEDEIAKDAENSVYYAIDILEAPFPKGENAISKDPETAYYYAEDIIKGRWPKGEKAISKSAKNSYLYALNFVKGRWPEGETSISKNPEYAVKYAKDILKGRFEKGEKEIFENKDATEEYFTFLETKMSPQELQSKFKRIYSNYLSVKNQ